MDGLVLVLAIILNPRSKAVLQRGEEETRDGASDDGGSGGHGDSTTLVTTAISASGVQDNKDEKSTEDSEDIKPIAV